VLSYCAVVCYHENDWKLLAGATFGYLYFAILQKVDHPRDVLFSSRTNAIALIAGIPFCVNTFIFTEA